MMAHMLAILKTSIASLALPLAATALLRGQLSPTYLFVGMKQVSVCQCVLGEIILLFTTGSF